jgi:hypothetical protein
MVIPLSTTNGVFSITYMENKIHVPKPPTGYHSGIVFGLAIPIFKPKTEHGFQAFRSGTAVNPEKTQSPSHHYILWLLYI